MKQRTREWAAAVRGISVLALFAIVATPVSAAPARPSHPGDADGVRNLLRGPLPGEGAAVRNDTTNLTFPTLQDAVNAASAGDVLSVLMPVLGEGQVLIDRDLTIRGETGTEVLLMTVDTGDTGDDRGWIVVDDGIDVHFQDLTFDGDGRDVFHGLRIKGTALIERCAFRNIRFGTYLGIAVVAFGAGPTHVIDSTFEMINRVGVLFFGAGVAGSTFVGSTYTGKGDGDFIDYGVEIGGGGMATVRDSRITDCRGVASVDGSISAGLLVSTTFGDGSEAIVESSEILDNSYGLATGTSGSDTSLLSAKLTRFVGNTTSGMRNESLQAADGENNWWGCNEGPADAACDAVSGDGVTDADPWLVLTVTANPAAVPIGGSATVEASLTESSDQVDTTALGTVRDGIPVLFDGGLLGSVAPVVSVTSAGTASTLFTAAVVGDDTVSASVDAATASAPITVLSILEIPTLQAPGIAVLALLLAMAGVTLARRRRTGAQR